MTNDDWLNTNIVSATAVSKRRELSALCGLDDVEKTIWQSQAIILDKIFRFGVGVGRRLNGFEKDLLGQITAHFK